jgi:hypothetical protein
MLKEFQLLAAGLQSPLMNAFFFRLKDTCERTDPSGEFPNVLFYFDAYLVITNSGSALPLRSSAIEGFRGFLDVEFDFDPIRGREIFCSVLALIVEVEIVSKADVPGGDDLDVISCVREYSRQKSSQIVKEYYQSFFHTSEGLTVFVDFDHLLGVYDISSRKTLRSLLTPYLARRANYEALTDACLIISILGGVGTLCPGVPLTEVSLDERDSRKFFDEILNESDRQALNAGLSVTEVGLNRQFLLRVILGFFVPNGLFFNLDYHSFV